MTDKTILLPPLKTGDTIGVMSPSSYIEPEKLAAGVAILEQAGFKVKIHPQTLTRYNQSAGSSDQKVAAFHDLLKDKDVKAIIAAIGGNRSAQMLEKLDIDTLRENPKTIMGFSDATALQNGIYAKAGLTSIYGPTISKLPIISPDSLRQCLKRLTSGHPLPFPTQNLQIVKTGSAKGVLIGGTLSVFCSLVGTPYLPTPQGKILFLEDVNEEMNRIDRMLWHLRTALPFEQLGGLLFGQFTSCQDTGGRPFGFTLEDIIKEHSAGMTGPVAMNAAFGHGEDLFPISIGLCGEMTLERCSGKDSRMNILI
jgi:muramoyltetrapeptide carboxypeptidase